MLANEQREHFCVDQELGHWFRHNKKDACTGAADRHRADARPANVLVAGFDGLAAPSLATVDQPPS